MNPWEWSDHPSERNCEYDLVGAYKSKTIYPQCDKRNASCQSLVLLYQKWVKDQCDLSMKQAYDIEFYHVLWGGIPNDYFHLRRPAEIAYDEQVQKVAQLASTKRFQQDCVKMKREICQSGLPKIFNDVPHDFLQKLCNDKN